MILAELLDSFEKHSDKTLNEHDIASELKQLIPEDKSKIEMDLRAELMAFEFVEDYPNKETGWGTYFGPMFVISNNDGTATESPSIKLVTSEIIEYWTKRVYESQNPILVARYSGLVWDFQNKIIGTNPNHKIPRLYIQALIDVSILKTYNGTFSVFKKIKRALEISSTLNDDSLIEKCKKSLIAFEKDNSKDTKPGLWGYCYDLLVGNKKVKLSKEEEAAIIIELENKLSRLTTYVNQDSKIDPWAAEAAADRLAQYYLKKNKLDDVRRIILKIGNAFEYIMKGASSMQASGWLEHLYRLYSKFNLKEEAAETLLRIRRHGPKVSKELKPIPYSIGIPRKEIEEYVNSIIDGSIDEFLEKFIFNFIPQKEEVKKQLFQLAKAAPFQFIVGQSLQDEKGRVVATIGSLENDLEGHIVRQVSENLTFSSLLMSLIIEKAKEKFSLTKLDIMEFIGKSPIIEKNRLPIIEDSLNAYFKNDYLVFTHLLIPQIEEAMRNLVELSGGNVLMSEKNGRGFQLKTFDEILRDPKLVEVVGSDLAIYFRILFTDSRGWNLRNNVFHGIASPNAFNTQTGHRLLHALLCLGLIRTMS
jgi:hypothetical protein